MFNPSNMASESSDVVNTWTNKTQINAETPFLKQDQHEHEDFR